MLLLGRKFSAHESLKANLLNDVFTEKGDAFTDKVRVHSTLGVACGELILPSLSLFRSLPSRVSSLPIRPRPSSCPSGYDCQICPHKVSPPHLTHLTHNLFPVHGDQLIKNNRRLALLDAVNKEEVELLGERFVLPRFCRLSSSAHQTSSFSCRWVSAECMQAVMTFMSRRQKASL
jgi:hypothetical protein